MSSPTRSSFLQFMIVFLLLAGLVVTVNCGEGPGGTTVVPVTPPPAPSPVVWQMDLDQGQYDRVIEGTSQVIAEGEGAEYYAEARLYRGLAELARGGDLRAVEADLDTAEKLIHELTTVDKTQEQALLLRGQMTIRARLGDIGAAENYRDQAIELAPDQREAILEEFERATQ